MRLERGREMAVIKIVLLCRSQLVFDARVGLASW